MELNQPPPGPYKPGGGTARPGPKYPHKPKGATHEVPAHNPFSGYPATPTRPRARFAGAGATLWDFAGGDFVAGVTWRVGVGLGAG